MAKKETLEFKRTINAPPSEVFLALTNSTGLREWFCDAAQIEPRKGGRVYFAWHQGYYAAGEVTRFQAGKSLAFTWAGRGEPDVTEVDLSVARKKGGSLVQVRHVDVRAGKKWKETAANITRGWQHGLENLQSVLETGKDQRLTQRPLLGVTGLEELTPEMSARLKVPVQHGVRVDGTRAGLGAAAAGLQKDDILISVGGHKVTSWPSLISALHDHRAGDKVAVGFYRDGEKRRVTLELSQRPVAEVPGTAAELAEAARGMYSAADAELEAALAGVGESEAAFKAAPGEWSVNEIIAHLVLSERDDHGWLAELVAGDEGLYSQSHSNSPLRTHACASTYHSPAALLEELKRHEAETVAILAALPDDFVQRKRSYWRAADDVLQGADHTREHLRQIEAAVAAARPTR